MTTTFSSHHFNLIDRAQFEISHHPVKMFLAVLASASIGGSFGIAILFPLLMSGDPRALMLLPHALVTMLVPTAWLVAMFSMLGREP